jgi:hypothetical protein
MKEPMPRYYFDFRDNDYFAVDEDGLDLPTIEAVRVQAARSLVDIVKQAVWTEPENVSGHRMAMEVRTKPDPCSRLISLSNSAGTIDSRENARRAQRRR